MVPSVMTAFFLRLRLTFVPKFPIFTTSNKRKVFKMANNMNFLYDNITNKIIKMLEDGTPPWRKSWRASDMPVNLQTKYAYRGVNVWLLIASPFATTPYWLTMNQINNLKGRIKDTELKNYETVVFWKIMKTTEKNRNNEEVEKTFPFIRYTRVWNLGQCTFSDEVLNKLVPKVEKKDLNPIEACEKIVDKYSDRPEINFGGNRAFYSPLFDKIQMPTFDSFESAEEFYSTEFHELAHSTGAEKRLKRFKATDTDMFGSETYSKEELVAEMTASFLCAEAQIEQTTLENSAAYVAGWLKKIKDSDNRFVLTAASKAQNAADYILGRNKTDDNEDKE